MTVAPICVDEKSIQQAAEQMTALPCSVHDV
jgi:hypothetical protein